MRSAASAPSPVRANLQWLVLWLLVVSVCINYVDRGNLSVAGVVLSHELHLGPKQLGYLLSAFFWTYAGFMIPAGCLIDRYNVIWVYAAGYLIWSGATALTGAVTGFAALFALRLALGMSESVAYPAYSKIIASSFPERQRGMANGLIDAGSKLGPALGMMIGGSILAWFGWRTMFFVIGGASLLWLAPWVITAPKIERSVAAATKGGPGFWEILKRRNGWGSCLALFGANYGWYFMLTWIPAYLQMERHYSTEQMALFGSLPFWAVALGAVIGGWLSDSFIRRGVSTTRVRKGFVSVGLTVCAFFLLPSVLAPNAIVAMVLLLLASFSFGFFSSNHWAITQTLAGPLAAGKWTGLQNCAGNMAGIVAPIITGIIKEQTSSFYFAFVWVCVNLLLSAFVYVFVLGKIETTKWQQDDELLIGKETFSNVRTSPTIRG